MFARYHADTINIADQHIAILDQDIPKTDGHPPVNNLSTWCLILCITAHGETRKLERQNSNGIS
ncbi:hypothetical protein D3C81_1200240 [compost metagenome]